MNRELFYKSEGVRGCVKWLEKEIKIEKQAFGRAYGRDINTMINIKISLEKYMKKLLHQADE